MNDIQNFILEQGAKTDPGYTCKEINEAIHEKHGNGWVKVRIGTNDYSQYRPRGKTVLVTCVVGSILMTSSRVFSA